MPSFALRRKRREQHPAQPLWQRSENVQKTRIYRQKMWVSLGLLAALAILVLGGYVYRAMTSGAWEGSEQFNFLVGEEGERLLLVSLDPGSDGVLVLDINPNLMITTVYGYGEYKAGSLLRLGRMEKLGSGLLRKSVQYTLGIKVSDVLAVSTADVSVIDADYLRGLARPMLFSLWGKPLGIVDVWRYIGATAALRDDQVTTVALHESRLAYSEPLADESIVYRIDQQRFDGFIQAKIHGSSYINEKLGVSIVNTTSHPGLASSLARVLLNAGIDVLSVGESQEQLTTSVIVGERPEVFETETADLIRELLPGSEMRPKSDAMRADLVVLLGEDYSDYLTKRP